MLLIVASFVLVRYYLAVGNFNWAGDVKQHIATAYMASRAIASGEFPFGPSTLATVLRIATLRIPLPLSCWIHQSLG